MPVSMNLSGWFLPIVIGVKQLMLQMAVMSNSTATRHYLLFKLVGRQAVLPEVKLHGQMISRCLSVDLSMGCDLRYPVSLWWLKAYCDVYIYHNDMLH